MTLQEELIHKINDAANHIANKSRKSQASWIITSAAVSNTLKGLDSKVRLRKLRKAKLEAITKSQKNKKTSE
jgi:hypothetical protein